MPAATGRGRALNREQQYIRKQALRSRMRRCHQILTRTTALRRVTSLLAESNSITGEAVDLVSLFHIQADELTEAGVPYEMVRALEKRYPLLLSQD